MVEWVLNEMGDFMDVRDTALYASRLFFWCIILFTAMLILMSMTGCGSDSQDIKGADGASVTTRPATGLECPNGGVTVISGDTATPVCNGLIGAPGPAGQPGAVGPQGPIGMPGQPGTSVTVVQFCSGQTTYPSTFTEVGLCISGNLYAVYSANNGFLSYLPPGRYTSNAINSRCDFTVAANCVVSP